MLKQIHRALDLPTVYAAMQSGSGFAQVRRKAIGRWLTFKPQDLVIDVGCGPGNILPYLPHDIRYIGFDIDATYIERARRLYGNRATFHARIFDVPSAEEFSPAACVMFNGVLHHLTDEQVEGAFMAARAALAPGGCVFTLDGCYRDGQGVLAKKLLDWDRGQFVRTQPHYESLVAKYFPQYETHVREDLSPIPYTFIIMKGMA